MPHSEHDYFLWILDKIAFGGSLCAAECSWIKAFVLSEATFDKQRFLFVLLVMCFELTEAMLVTGMRICCLNKIKAFCQWAPYIFAYLSSS